MVQMVQAAVAEPHAIGLRSRTYRPEVEPAAVVVAEAVAVAPAQAVQAVAVRSHSWPSERAGSRSRIASW